MARHGAAQDDILQATPFGKPNILTNLERGSLDEPTFLSPNTGNEFGAPNVWHTLPNMYERRLCLQRARPRVHARKRTHTHAHTHALRCTHAHAHACTHAGTL